MTLTAQDRRQRRTLIGLALMFFAPLGLSFYLYYGKSWHPGGRVNAGELIAPARPLPSLALPLAGTGETNPQFLKGKWTFLYLQHGPCDDDQAPAEAVAADAALDEVDEPDWYVGEPTAEEAKRFHDLLADAAADGKTTRREALEDLFWAVLASKEFVFNH